MADATTCMVDLNDGRARLDCRPGMTLYAALRTHKLFLPTGCGARGLCGQCRVKLLRGPANEHTDSEKALLSAADLADGHRLGCQLRLSGDIGVEVPEAVFSAREHKVVVDAITPLTHDIRRFGLVPADADRFPHKAGQFLNFVVRIPEEKAIIVRCFSFSTPSSVEDRIDIVVRLNPKGKCTPYMFERLKVGDPITVIAPFGEFGLTESKAPCVWIAGGSGLSPFLGMVQDMIDKGVTDRPVHLFFGAVKPGDLYYVDHFRAISRDHPWFSFTPALSGEERSPKCREYGLVTEVVARHVADATGREGYLCGSPGMIDACIRILVERGVRREDIYYDRFQ